MSQKVKVLVPLELHNAYMVHLDSWEPFQGHMTGFSCPKCQSELSYVGGGFFRREGRYLSKLVLCKTNYGGCGYSGKVLNLPVVG